MLGRRSEETEMKAKAEKGAAEADVDAYMADVPNEKARAALSTLRTRIKAAAPSATEGVSYGVPMFKIDGHLLVGFGAAKNHCALYGVSVDEMGPLLPELERFDTSKGTVRFTPDEPLSAALVKKIVKLRVASIEARWGTGRR